MKPLVRIGQFALRHADQRSWTGVSCAVNLSPTEAERGHLLLLISVPLPPADAEQLADALADHITTSYYTQPLTAAARPENNPPELEPLFEQLIKQTNAWLGRTLKTHGHAWLEHSDILIGVARGPELVFSLTGNIHPFLIQTKGMTDLVTSTRSGGGYFNPFKPLASLIAGKLEPGARVAIVTDGVLDYLSRDRLRKIITAQPAHEAAQVMMGLLRIPKTQMALAGIILEPLWADIARAQDNTRRQELYTEQASVRTLTAPSEPITTNNYLARAQQQVQQLATVAKSAAPAVSASFHKLATRLITALKIPGGAQKTIQKYRRTQNTNSSTSRGSNLILLLLQSAGHALAHWLTVVWRWFRRLPRSSQILLMVSMVFAVLFLKSIVTVDGSSSADQERSYTILTNAINEKIKTAESALIYKDETKSTTLLNEASELLSALPKNSSTRRNRAQELQQRVTELLNRTNQISAVSTPRLLLELSQLDPPYTNYVLVPSQAGPLLFGTDGATIWNLPSGQNPLLLRRGGTNDIKTPQLVALDQSLLLIGAGGELLEAKTNPPTITLWPDKLNFVPRAVVSYDNRLFLLAPDQKKLIKTGIIPQQVSAQKSWVADATDVSKAISMAVDGSVYLLMNNGLIAELRRGSKTGWQTNIAPALTSPTKIWTKADSNYLYVLDPASQRIVAVQKSTGKVKIQYTSQLFQNPSHFAVNERTKELFVIDGTKLFVVPMTHL